MTPELKHRWESAIDDLTLDLAELQFKPVMAAADMYRIAEKYRKLAEILVEKEAAERIDNCELQ